MSTSDPISDGAASTGPSLGSSIDAFYGESGVSDTSPFQEDRFRAQLTEELLRGRDHSAEASVSVGKGLRLPLLLLALSLGFGGGALALATGSYRVSEEKLFLEPSELFGTEILLIDTLRKRADFDINARDRMITEYRTRSQRREEYAKVLQAAESAAAEPANAEPVPDASQDLAAPASQAAELEALGRAADLQPYIAQKWDKTLDAVASGLRELSPQTAAKALDDFRSALSAPALSGSTFARSAMGLTSALSSSLGMAATPGSALAPGAALAPESDAGLDSDDTVIAAMQKARAQNLALVDDNRELEQENARLKQAASASTAEIARLKVEGAAAAKRAAAVVSAAFPTIGFLGNVSVISDGSVLVDVAQPASPSIGAVVALFRPGGEGKGTLVAIGQVRALRGTTAELAIKSYLDEGTPLLIRDTAYFGR